VRVDGFHLVRRYVVSFSPAERQRLLNAGHGDLVKSLRPRLTRSDIARIQHLLDVDHDDLEDQLAASVELSSQARIP
jgi:hypothetical protein